MITLTDDEMIAMLRRADMLAHEGAPGVSTSAPGKLVAADVQTLVMALRECREVLRDEIDCWPPDHEDGCPEDDTCACQNIRDINIALGARRRTV